ncbi:MAG: hypothetical protein K2G87_09015 [Oscillospiraceae bacterium]|nr:hypothetical protein [Oscillospiraceae bacterium]
MKIIKTIEMLGMIILILIGTPLAFMSEHSQNGNVKYNLIDFNNDGISEFLIISGNGTVTAKPHYSYNDVEIIYVCQGITAVAPQAFADLQSLKFLIMPSTAYSQELNLPMQTDLFFIDDEEYKEFVNQYI